MSVKNRESVAHLEKLANEFLIENFNLELNIPIEISGRLSTTQGYFKWRKDMALNKKIPVNITISKKLFQYYEYSDVIDTLYHECVHYALFLLDKPHRDGDSYFENTLQRLGVSSTGTLGYRGKMHLYECQDCDNQFTQERRFNVERYHCAHCEGKLKHVKEFIKRG